MAPQETEITCKETCVQYCREQFQARLGHELIFSRKGCNAYQFTLVCRSCLTPIVSAKCSRTSRREATFVVTDLGVGKVHPIPNKPEESCYPDMVNGKIKDTIAELAKSTVLNVAVNDVSTVKGRNRGMSTKGKKALLRDAGCGDITESSIKAATALLRITPMEHINSYKAIIPYFMQWQKLNPTLAYDIAPKEDGVFERLTVVMPYTKAFLPYMLKKC